MSGPHFVEILGRDWQVFALVWGLNLGDQLEVVDGWRPTGTRSRTRSWSSPRSWG
jgi:hypothetical protein